MPEFDSLDPSLGPVGRARLRIDRTRASVKAARKALLTPKSLRGVAVEVAWVAAHAALYPLGIVEERAREEVLRHNLEGLPPAQRGLIIGDVEAAGTPIILIHGVIDNHTIFTLLRRGLNRRGFGKVISLNYSPLTDDIRRVSRRLSILVEAVCRETGYERVHVIGHSMGGFAARYYVQRSGGHNRVHTLITLGTPHSGTAVAQLIPHTVARQMRPDSEVVKELAEPAPQCRTRMIAIWSDLDQMISPKRNARILHPDLNARNILIRGVGHMSLPVSGRVVHEICTALAHLDADGSTLAAGATSIASTRRRPQSHNSGTDRASPALSVSRSPDSAAKSSY